MSGKMNNIYNKMTLHEFLNRQYTFQSLIDKHIEPKNEHKNTIQQSVTHLVAELGEMLQANQHWKTHHYNYKIYDDVDDEMADILLCAMNVAFAFGYTPDDIPSILHKKLNKNINIVFNTLDKDQF